MSVREWGVGANLLAWLAKKAIGRLVERYGAQVTSLNGGHIYIRDHRGHVKVTSKGKTSKGV